MKGFVALAAMFLSLSTSAFPQAPSPASQDSKPAPSTKALPAADKVLDNYIKAIGGREAWKKLTSRISTGTIDVPAMNLSGTIEIREKAPDRVVATITFNSAKFRQGYDGAAGWTDDTQNGLREQTGAELTETKRDADFYHPLDLHQLYSSFTVKGVEKIGERDAYAIEAQSPTGGTDQMYFDVESGLVVRIAGQHHTPDGVVAFTEDLGDYREVDGVKLPFSVHQSSADSSFSIQFSEIRHNVSLPDSDFSKPVAP